MTRSVELYGRLREAGLGGRVTVEVARGARAREVLAAVAARLGAGAALLDGAALATDREVLAPSRRVPARGRLAVLPPVCGG